MRKNIVELVADYIGCDIATIADMSANAPTSYKLYYIPKKTGGSRAIYHPAKTTKSLQYALMDTVLSKLDVHDCARAYIRNEQSPLRRNAEEHAPYKYTISTDFKDFFPSIGPQDLFHTINDNDEWATSPLVEGERLLLRSALFLSKQIGQWELAIGAPSSPMISNAVMYSVDERLAQFARRYNAAYTRYADDIAYSTNEKGNCADFLLELRKVISEVKSPVLQINENKTCFSSRGSRRVITGLVVEPNGSISIGRKRKRYIKKLLNDYKYQQLEPSLVPYLQGYLAFILDVEPEFYNRLAMKYTAGLVKKALDAMN